MINTQPGNCIIVYLSHRPCKLDGMRTVRMTSQRMLTDSVLQKERSPEACSLVGFFLFFLSTKRDIISFRMIHDLAKLCSWLVAELGPEPRSHFQPIVHFNNHGMPTAGHSTDVTSGPSSLPAVPGQPSHTSHWLF